MEYIKNYTDVEDYIIDDAKDKAYPFLYYVNDVNKYGIINKENNDVQSISIFVKYIEGVEGNTYTLFNTEYLPLSHIKDMYVNGKRVNEITNKIKLLPGEEAEVYLVLNFKKTSLNEMFANTHINKIAFYGFGNTISGDCFFENSTVNEIINGFSTSDRSKPYFNANNLKKITINGDEVTSFNLGPNNKGILPPFEKLMIVNASKIKNITIKGVGSPGFSYGDALPLKKIYADEEMNLNESIIMNTLIEEIPDFLASVNNEDYGRIKFCHNTNIKRIGKINCKCQFLDDMLSDNTSLLTIDEIINLVPKLNYNSSASYLCYGCTNLKTINKIKINTKNLRGAFKKCSSLTTINELEFNTASYKDLFFGCESLESIPTIGRNDISEESGDDNSCAFSGCKRLKTVKLKNLRNSSDISQMFMNCESLTKIDLSDINSYVNPNTNVNSLFQGLNPNGGVLLVNQANKECWDKIVAKPIAYFPSTWRIETVA